MKAVRFAATLKAAALNILRAAAFRKQQNKAKRPLSCCFRRSMELIQIVKEHFYGHLGKFTIATNEILVA
jgi:hypothetical protein